MRLNNGNEHLLKNDRVLNIKQFSISVRRSFKMRIRKGRDGEVGKTESQEVALGVWA